MAKDKKKFNDNTSVQIDPTGKGIFKKNHTTGETENLSNPNKRDLQIAEGEKRAALEKKPIRKLNLKEKKTFINLHETGAHSQAYFSYLALTPKEVTYFADKIEKIKEEVANEELVREERLAKSQLEAHRINEEVKETGVFPSEKTGPVKEEWFIEKKEEGDFLKHSAIWSLPRLANYYGVSVKDVEREIVRLENSE